jgi:hypothetical protein
VPYSEGNSNEVELNTPDEAVGSKMPESAEGADGETEKEKMSSDAAVEEKEVDGGPKREPGSKEEEVENDEAAEGREGEDDADLFTKALPLEAVSRLRVSDWSFALGLDSGVRLPGTPVKMDTDEASRKSGGLKPLAREPDGDEDNAADDEEVDDEAAGGPKIDPMPPVDAVSFGSLGMVAGPKSEPGLKDTEGAAVAVDCDPDPPPWEGRNE